LSKEDAGEAARDRRRDQQERKPACARVVLGRPSEDHHDRGGRPGEGDEALDRPDGDPGDEGARELTQPADGDDEGDPEHVAAHRWVESSDGTISAPATPASPALSAKVGVKTRSTLIPRAATMPGGVELTRTSSAVTPPVRVPASAAMGCSDTTVSRRTSGVSFPT
jgi:hypothetical protein